MSKQVTLSQTVLDCADLSTREINQQLKAWAAEGIEQVEVINPAGRHNLAVGLETLMKIRFQGAVGYYFGGMGENVDLEVNGLCGWSVGENLMSGRIVIRGNASACAGASAHGGEIYILGNAGARAGIALKGATLIITGNVGHSSAFMMQQGRIIVCGNAGNNLGDSIYEGEIFVGGEIRSLGADAKLEEMTDTDWQLLNKKLQPLDINPQKYDFKKIVCAKQLYNFKAKDWATLNSQ